MFFRAVLFLAALSGLAVGAAGRRLTEGDACVETGSEVYKREGKRQDIKMKVQTKINKKTCTYSLEMSFDGNDLDRLGIPFMDSPTQENFFTEYFQPAPTPTTTDFGQTCVAEGLYFVTGDPAADTPWDFPTGSAGDLVHYTTYQYTKTLGKKAREATGFKEVTIDVTPCGTATQPFPHYNVHFYLVDKEVRDSWKCFSQGDYFCKDYDSQCSDAGRKMQMDGVGIPRCADDDSKFANVIECPDVAGIPVPLPFAWALDPDSGGSLAFNAATPGMGLHGLCPNEVIERQQGNKSLKEPYQLMVQYDSEIAAMHYVFWSGGARGEGFGETMNGEDVNVYTYHDEYTCLDEDKQNLPTFTEIAYDENTGRTSVTIEGRSLGKWCRE